MNIFKNPSWIDEHLLSINSLDSLPESIFPEINRNLDNLQSKDPLVSVVIPCYNEELNIVRTLLYLSRNKTTFGVEIIVVDNNSTDRTADVLKRLHVKTFVQAKPGCGPARQLGQERALGEYILMADADCFYPLNWIEKMTRALREDQVTCVYGRYSFLGTPEKPRWKLFMYEFLRDYLAELRHMKRPCMNAVGMSMGYVKKLGLQVGFVDRKIRGEDGRMCFALMQLGKIRQLRDRSMSVWTLPRALDREGGLAHALTSRVIRELSRINDYFTTQAPHDVHASENYNPVALKQFRKLKKALRNKTSLRR